MASTLQTTKDSQVSCRSRYKDVERATGNLQETSNLFHWIEAGSNWKGEERRSVWLLVSKVILTVEKNEI